jgi:hypothetical protein
MHMFDTSDSHFARVEPIVGAGLRSRRVALIGLPAAAPLVTHLAACGVGRWLWATDTSDGSDAAAERLRERLLAQHGSALALDAAALPHAEWAAAINSDPPDLLIAVGDAGQLAAALDLAVYASIPALLVVPPSDTSACHAITVFPGDDFAVVKRYLRSIVSTQSKIEYWDWHTAAPLCAGLARAMLLRETIYRRADLAALWEAGKRVLTLGAGHCFDIVCSALTPSPLHLFTRSFQTPRVSRGALLIAGLGSLGSVAATYLAGAAATLLLADSECVDAYNPVRQAYSLAAVGRPKALALCDALLAAGAPHVVALEAALTEERAVAELVDRYDISAALVATGTAADFAIARALRERDVPHVVGRCYPRARFWEAIVVDGQRGPAFGELRGRVAPGPIPAPTPEQIAAYSDAGALEAEPATLIESGWAAAWLARITAQLLAPAGLRERWLLEILAAGQTCLIGGVGVEHTLAGPAYAIELPGQICAWARDALS